MNISEILKRKGTRIITVRLDETIEIAARLLRRENIGAVVVKDVCATEGDVIVGMLSERDILRALVDRGPGAMKLPVSMLMSQNVIACTPNESVASALETMKANGIRHLPVLEGQFLVGVVSVRDLIQPYLGGEAVVSAYQSAPSPARAA